ncbi:MAG: DNA primase [Lautropia sp.]|nr:DNA primase [Lautropia sp.]
MIPQSFIQELLARIDIVDVVGRAVKLKKAGANLQGLCPFHNEKTPSFSVSPTKQFYHCFGCGAHGSAISFLMEHHGLGFVDAVRELADEAGLDVPREGRPEDAQKHRKNTSLTQWLEQAAAYYRQRLKETPAAIEYLKQRGLTGETAKTFGLGYAPAGWRNLDGILPDYSAAEAEESGLVIASDEGKRYDRFRERVMFPIRNPRGQVIGFGGRVMGQGEPKYLNSPEGPLFSKRRELYGLYEGREAIRAEQKVLVVEGYMDVVMLHQHGCRYAVATLGTAMTSEHLTKLNRVTDEVIFCFDGDAAGRRAAWRALENALPLLADTKRLKFLFLPPEHDPDSYVREHGLSAFDQLLHEALPLSSFMMRELMGRVDTSTPEGRAQMQAALKPLIVQMPDIALRTQIVMEMAARLGLQAEDLFAYCGLRVRPVAAPLGRSPDRRGERQVHQRHARGQDDRQGGFDEEDAMAAYAFAGYGEPVHGGADRMGDLLDEPSPASGRRDGPWEGRRRERGWDKGWDKGRNERWPTGRRQGRDGGRGAQQGGWSGAGASRVQGTRMRPARPTLSQQLCLLLAYHPALAKEPVAETEFIPTDLLRWQAQLAALPDGASFAGALAVAIEQNPELSVFIETQDEKDAGILAAMTLDEARDSLRNGICRLRLDGARQESMRLIAEGLDKPGVSTRYSAVEALKQRLSEELAGSG